jgi:hypothetical protein
LGNGNRNSHNMSKEAINLLDLKSYRQLGKPQGESGVSQRQSINFGTRHRAQTREVEQNEEPIAKVQDVLKRCSLDSPDGGIQLSNDNDDDADEGSREQAKQLMSKDEVKWGWIEENKDPWDVLL